MMNIFANRYFLKSMKNYKNILNGIIILIFSLIVGNALFSIILYGSLDKSTLNICLFIDFIILLSFLLYSLKSKDILYRFSERKFYDIFNFFRSLNYFSFIFIFLIFFPLFHLYLLKILIIIVLIVKCLKKYSQLKKRDIRSKLQDAILLVLIFIVLGMVISLIQIFSFSSYLRLVGPVFVLIGMALMNNKVLTYFSIQNLEISENLQKSLQIINQSKISGQNSENITEQAPEIKVIKAEFEPDLVNISKNSIQEEVLKHTSDPTVLNAEIKQELARKPEIAPKEEISKPVIESIVANAEIEPEIVIQPKSISRVEINRRKISENPIQSKIVKKEAKPLVLKKCPFCGKKREDLNIPFCYACGYKF